MNRGGKGSYRNFFDEFGHRVTRSGQEGDDAKPYQEKEVAENVAKHAAAKAAALQPSPQNRGNPEPTRKAMSKAATTHNTAPTAVDRRPRGADYLKIVEWSEEDSCFVGSAPPLIGRACHGDDEADVYRQLCEIVEVWLETLARDGVKPPAPTANKGYSGKFLLRTGEELHKALAIRAWCEGDSLNNYCVKVLKEAV